MIGVGVATAAPGDGGQITACYQKSTGAMRVIDPGAGQQCTKSEAQLTWSTGTSLPPGSVTGGPGGVVADNTLTEDDLAPNSVGSSELAPGSVDTGELADAAVTSIKIFNGSVTNDDLANNAVTSDKIEDSTINTNDLGTGAVGSGDLAFNSVTTGKIVDGEVGTDDLATSAVTAVKILDGEIGNVELAVDAVTTDKIEDGSVGNGDLAGDAVTSNKIDTGAVNTGDLADGAVTAEKVTANLAATFSSPPPADPTERTFTVASVGHEAEAGHKLLVLAQTQLTCTCSMTDTVTIKWQVFENDVQVSQPYQTVLTGVSNTSPATVSALIPSATGGDRTYQLKVSSVSTAPSWSTTGDSLSIIDLGR